MKKLLSLALVLAMVLTSFSFVYAADLIEGLTGAGTEADPVLIGSVADYNLVAAASASNSFDGNYFKLTNNLDFEGAEIAQPIGTDDTTFKGVFDGNGKIISNYALTNNSVSGLFGRADGNSVIKNLGVEGVTVNFTADYPVGGIVGRMYGNAKISNCFARNFGTHTFPAADVTMDAGGIVGQLREAGTSMDNCYALNIGFGNDVTINNNGELFGSAREFTEIKNCYANNYMGVVYNNYTDKINNCYFTTTLETSFWPGWYNPETGANDRWSSNALHYVGYKVTDDELKALAISLNGAFNEDTDGTLNGGYPVLAWQGGTEPVLPPSTDATLASLTVSSGTLSPKFNSGITEYTLSVENAVETITVSGTATDANASVAGGAENEALEVGVAKTITLTVTAEDGTTTKTYTVVVTRLAENATAPEEEKNPIPEEAPADAVLIYTIDDLKALATGSTEGKYYVLMEDLDFKDGVWSTYIGTAANPFKGTFHGNNHAIRNVRYKNTGANKVGYGIFGYVDGNAVIKYVGVENVEMFMGDSGPYYSGSAFGGLIGWLQGNAKVEHCFAKDVRANSKTLPGTSWAPFNGDQVSYAGGMIGATLGYGCEITNCYSLNFQEINDAASSEGGLIGGIGGTVELKDAAGNKTGETRDDGSFKAVTNCYSDTSLTSCRTQDLARVKNCYAVDTTGWSAYGNKPGTTVTVTELKNKAADLGDAYISDIQELNGGYPMLAWEMNLTRLEGNGSEENPFLITDVDTLAQVASHRDTAGKFYKLTSDISFEGAKLTTYIGTVTSPFKGTFDGDGHIIRDFVIAPPVSGMPSYLGIFAAIGGEAIVKNVGVANVTVSPAGEWGYNSIVGGLVAVVYDKATVANAFARNIVFDASGNTSYAINIGGGLIGRMYGEGASVTNCYATGVKQTSVHVGSLSGLVGTAESFSSIQNCYSDSTLTMVKNADLGKTINSYYVEDDDATAYMRTSGRITSTELKNKLTDLGSAYVADDNNINYGYPIQKWEAGMTPDDVISPSAKYATLKSITVSDGTLVPAFDPEVTEYTLTLENTVNKISVSGTPTAAKATVTGAVTDQELEVGVPYVVTLLVTSQDGSTTKTYTVTVTRQAPPTEPGASDTPVEIATVDDLKALAEAVDSSVYGMAGYTYKLTADLDLNDEAWNNYVIGKPEKPFEGIFDGNGHTISNLLLDLPAGNFAEAEGTELDLGLFGCVGGNGEVKNLGIIDAEFISSSATWGYNARGGAIAGKLIDNAKIDSCFVRNVVYDTGKTANRVVQFGEAGGMFGYVNGAGVEITNCYVIGHSVIGDCVAHNAAMAGLINEVAKVENCYAENSLCTIIESQLSKVVNSYCTNNSMWAYYVRGGEQVTADALKGMVDTLGAAFKAGTSYNNGFPVLAWEPDEELPPEEPKVIEGVEATDTEVVSVTLGKVDEEAYLIVALFDGNKLIGQKFITVDAADTYPVGLTIGNADTVKVFVMTSGLMPLAPAEVITK